MIFYLKKIFEFFATLFFVTIATFFVFQILPGNAALAILGPDADEVQIANLQAELGLEKNAAARYAKWLCGVFRGDFGKSYKYSKSVSQVISEAFWPTFSLFVFAFFLSTLFGIAFGIFTALKEKNPLSFALSILSQVWISLPAFCTAIFLIMIFCVKFRIFPSMGFVAWSENPFACVRSLFLPALSLALANGAVLCRYLKNSIQTESKKDYVKTLFAKGLGRPQIARRILKNSLLPALTMMGILASDILGGSIIIENVFAIPGIGRLVAASIYARDFPLLQTLTLYLAAITIFCNFCVDILHSAIDPRIRIGGGRQ